MDTLIDDNGRVIPALVTIGNHEVRGSDIHRSAVVFYLRDEGYDDATIRTRIAPFFYALFAFPGQPGYGVVDFGDYMSIFLLDSHHSNYVHREQLDWLEQAIAERAGRPHLFPIYHVPAYPSHRSYNAGVSDLIRRTWLPLFEAHGVRVAFENHDHTYKRTHPILAGEVHEDGIVYIGDGAWGVPTRPNPHAPEDTWYLARSGSINHFILVTLDGERQHYQMIDQDGNEFDTFESPHPR